MRSNNFYAKEDKMKERHEQNHRGESGKKSSVFNEKIAVCYSCAGESYRESAVRQLENSYFDDDNLYYYFNSHLCFDLIFKTNCL